MPRSRKEDFKRNTPFYTLNPKIISLSEIYNFCSPCPTDGIMLQTKFNKDGSSSSWEEDVKGEARRTTHDDGRLPIPI